MSERHGEVHVDGHVHTQFSWDAPRGDMEATCRRALEIGLPSLAFTEHADYVQGVHRGLKPLDTAAYVAELTRCRSQFPGLRILAGIELGEPHLYPDEVAKVISEVAPDRTLGSVHVVTFEGATLDGSQISRVAPDRARAFQRAHLEETLRLVQSEAPFQVLAHLDYPKRYWPHDVIPFEEADFEEELRCVLRALARRDGVLEVNTTRGIEHRRGLCPGPTTLRWWHQEGGGAVAFGSDSHVPDLIAAGFREAAQVAEAAGFRPCDDPGGYWLR